MSLSDADRRDLEAALPAFIEEAHEQLAVLEQELLALEEDPGQRDRLDALFRSIHTIKGSAGVFGLDAIAGFTHHVETVLDLVREGQLTLDTALGTLLLSCADEIRQLIAVAEGVHTLTPDDDTHCADLVAQLNARTTGGHATPATGAAVAPGAAPESASAIWRIDARFGPDTFRHGMDPLALLAYLRGLGELTHAHLDTQAVPALEALDPESCHLHLHAELTGAITRDALEAAFTFVRDDCELTLDEVSAAQSEPVPAPAVQGIAHDGTPPREAVRRPSASEDGRQIRVQADRLDALINLLGELVVAGAGAEMLARQSRQTGLIEATLHMGRLIEEVRNGALQLRMVPIGDTFARFRRVVRDTAADLGKSVALDIEGGDTELDKSVVEKIADPLMHLVRNALDHGIEAPADRVAAGKPAQAQLRLSAHHEAGSIVIRIIDDGRGIRRRKVLERAWERGLVPRDSHLSDAEVLALLFEPGFSTAEQVTQLSGRGVGMDVVRRNIEALRGTVQITSDEGAGTHVTLRLPLTLAIIDGFLVSVGGARFILPLESVDEVIEHRTPQQGGSHRGRHCVELRGRVLPVINLRSLYGVGGPVPARVSVVVVQSAGVRYGIEVDALLGQHQTVIKPLGRIFKTLRGISGSSILGNGEVALIFDVHALRGLASTDATAEAAPTPLPLLTSQEIA